MIKNNYYKEELKHLKVENLNLHGLNLQEAKEKTRQNVNWLLQHGVDLLVINHGKGLHSSNNFAVLKSEIRKLLKEELITRDSGYVVIYGESDYPIALTYNEGNTLIAARGLENQFLGGKTQQEKNHWVFSEEGKKARKNSKSMRKNNKYR